MTRTSWREGRETRRSARRGRRCVPRPLPNLGVDVPRHRIAVVTLPPFLMGAARFVAAGALLFAFARIRGAPRATAVQWRSASIVGACLLLGGNGGLVWALKTIPSGVGSLLVATTSLSMSSSTGSAPAAPARQQGFSWGLQWGSSGSSLRGARVHRRGRARSGRRGRRHLRDPLLGGRLHLLPPCSAPGIPPCSRRRWELLWPVDLGGRRAPGELEGLQPARGHAGVRDRLDVPPRRRSLVGFTAYIGSSRSRRRRGSPRMPT